VFLVLASSYYLLLSLFLVGGSNLEFIEDLGKIPIFAQFLAENYPNYGEKVEL
jgi:hypothetical protein